MATFTYTKPTVGGSEDTWGTTLNANWDALGTFLGSLDSGELAVLDGVTLTTDELNLLDGATLALANITSTAAELNLLDGVTATTAEINYLSGVTGAIQTQIDNIPQPPELTQVQVEDDTSTVFGQVSGERLSQAVAEYLSARTFTSGEIAYTNGGLVTAAHGLSVTPKHFDLSAICKTADLNFSVGDVVGVNSMWTASANFYGATIWADATNVYIRTASLGPSYLNPTGTGQPSASTPTATSWRYLIRARA